MAHPRLWPKGSYAYLFCYPDGTPYYAGVGTGNRARSVTRNRFANSVDQKIRRTGRRTLRIIIETETRDEACLLERSWISRYGRRHLKTGILANITDGGECGSSGLVWTDSMRRAVSVKLKGRKRSAAARRAVSEGLRGNKNALGLRHSDSTRALISLKGKGKKLALSEEERKRRSEHMRNFNRTRPPRKGAVCSKEHRDKLSAAKRAYHART